MKLHRFFVLVPPLLGVLAVFSQSPWEEPIPPLLDGDNVYMLMLVDDVLAGRPFREWTPPPAPVLVPDGLLMIPSVLLARILTSTPGSFAGAAQLCYALLFGTLISLTAMSMLRRLQKNDDGLARRLDWAVSLGMCLFAVLVAAGFQKIRLSEFWIPSFHGGAFLAALILLRLCQASFASVMNARWFVVLIAVALLSLFAAPSDKLFLIYGSYPAAVLVLLHRLLRPGHDTLLRLGLRLAAILIPVRFAEPLTDLVREREWLLLSPRYFSEMFKQLVEWHDLFDLGRYVALAETLIERTSVVYWAAGLLFVVLLGLVLLRWFRRRDGEFEQQRFFLAAAVGLCLALSTAALVLVGAQLGLAEVRYGYPLYVLPFLFGPAFVVLLLHERGRATALVPVVSGGLVSALVAGVLFVSGHRLPDADQRGTLTPCLEELAAEHGLRYGYADYWNTKPVNLLNEAGLHILQLRDGDLGVYYWVNNLTMFTRDDLTADQFNFVITERLPREKILAEFGEPRLRLHCGVAEILLYDPARDAKFRAHFDVLQRQVPDVRALKKEYGL